MATRFNELQFEPHNGYGKKDPDGEPWPFGYISTAPTPTPVFELNVILKHPRALLEDLAVKMAAAPEMFEALEAVFDTVDGPKAEHFAAMRKVGDIITKIRGE